MEIEKLIKTFKQVFKYRNSIIFRKEYSNENDFLNSLRTKAGLTIDIDNEDKLHLSKILEVTKLDLREFKKVISDINYYNMYHYLYNVNDFLTDLLNKNDTLRNYIDKVISDLAKDKVFEKLDGPKIERILSLFSEIICIGNLVSGKPPFVLSANKEKEYKKNGRFDLIIAKDNLSYYFDVKQINSPPIEKWNNEEYTKIENKIKTKIDDIIKKGHNENINRPLFLLLDLSDWAWLEEVGDGAPKAGWIGDKILKILDRFFNENRKCMQDLENIVCVGLFYSFIGVTKDGEFASIFWHQGYTNKNHKFLNEKNQIIELNNLIFEKLMDEQKKIISRYTDSDIQVL